MCLLGCTRQARWLGDCETGVLLRGWRRERDVLTALQEDDDKPKKRAKGAKGAAPAAKKPAAAAAAKKPKAAAAAPSKAQVAKLAQASVPAAAAAAADAGESQPSPQRAIAYHLYRTAAPKRAPRPPQMNDPFIAPASLSRCDPSPPNTGAPKGGLAQVEDMARYQDRQNDRCASTLAATLGGPPCLAWWRVFTPVAAAAELPSRQSERSLSSRPLLAQVPFHPPGQNPRRQGPPPRPLGLRPVDPAAARRLPEVPLCQGRDSDGDGGAGAVVADEGGALGLRAAVQGWEVLRNVRAQRRDGRRPGPRCGAVRGPVALTAARVTRAFSAGAEQRPALSVCC